MRVVIFGGGADLAKATIKNFLDSGNEVVAVYRTNPPKIPHKRLYLVQELEAEKGLETFDVLVTMTGSVSNNKLLDLSPEQWNSVIEDTLTSVYRGIRLGLRSMREGGNIVVVGSIIGSRGGVGCTNYAAAKAGLVGLVRSVAQEQAVRKICINLLELGYVNGGMGAKLNTWLKDVALSSIPLRRFCEPEEVAEAIAFLAKTRYMTGDILRFAGGLR